jgi:two-component system, chemotaxis family, chemotaxis protein CheY
MRTTPSSPVEAITGSIRVLIAQDNSYWRKLIRNLLVNVGVKSIDEVTDGLAAFDAIKSLEPDIVILDWELPLLSGTDLVRIVRTPGMLANAALPIIMLGASAERRRIAEVKRLGIDAYLTMPISAKTLLDRIVTILTRSRPAPAAEPQGDRDPSASTLFLV